MLFLGGMIWVRRVGGESRNRWAPSSDNTAVQYPVRALLQGDSPERRRYFRDYLLQVWDERPPSGMTDWAKSCSRDVSTTQKYFSFKFSDMNIFKECWKQNFCDHTPIELSEDEIIERYLYNVNKEEEKVYLAQQ